MKREFWPAHPRDAARPHREKRHATAPTARARHSAMTVPARRIDRLRAWLLACLPQHALSRITLYATRRPGHWRLPVMRWFIRRFGVDMSEAADPEPARYPTFNAFFTRALAAGARPLAGDADTVVSPVDGRVSQAGAIAGGRLYQAKGIDYALADLLAGDDAAAAALSGGHFATLYLAPGDYHRIHMPLAGSLQRMAHVPGRLFSVAPWTVSTVPGLFARNERVVTLFDTPAGPLGIVLVGAINVAAIETTWAGQITPPRGRRVTTTDYGADGPGLARGAEMGRFNMGSTVIVLTPPGVDLAAVPGPGERVRVGQRLGHAPAPSARGRG
jgi:phosphatidylserine decarboxylase